MNGEDERVGEFEGGEDRGRDDGGGVIECMRHR